MITWRKISQNLSNKERIMVGWLIIIAIASLVVSAVAVYYHYTKVVPIAGGDYTEGVVGQPLYVNPVLASANDADADLCALIYSGLFKYDADGKIVPDLAESYEVTNDKLTYTVHLKKDVKWHDGEPFSAADVLFTIQAIQDPAFKSPLRQSWQGVGVEMVDDNTIHFLLQTPYAFFLNNLSVGILPKHIWETIAPGNYPLAEYNLRPVGTGPYKFVNFDKDGEGNILSYQLAANEEYYSDKPYITNFNLSFYYDEDSMAEAYNNKQIFGMSYVSPSKVPNIKSRRSSDIHSINIPRYFAVFFNQQKSKVLADIEVRKALSMAIDRQTIVKEVLSGEGKEIYSPIPPGTFGFTDDVIKYSFDVEKANKTLEDDGWKKGDDGFRAKNGQPLEFKMETTDWPDLTQTADILKQEWAAVGAKVDYESLPVTDIQQNFIRPREYEALLFGQMLGVDPDPFAFWHSSQTHDPGMNLALYHNPDVDKLLEKIRQEIDPASRLDLYKKFQQDVASDVPAAFLYSPNYLYVTSKKVQGVDINSVTTPDRRFSDVTKWYVRTKRVKK
jgi:peptide/nickel transport system substrate-binding protein